MKLLRVVLGASILAVAASCGSSRSTTTPTTPTNPSGPSTTVSIPMNARTLGSSAYAPNPVTVGAGTTVMWTNNDSITHTATSDTNGFDSGAIGAGRSFSFTFQTRGNFAYHCTIHPGMIGTVIVQ